MPIASHKPTSAPPVEQTNVPRIESPAAQTIVVNDAEIPLRSLMAYMEGAPWTVDYYQQVVNRDNDLREVDPGQPGIYQQYQKINRFELRVTTPLASSYDSEQAITSVTGTALVHPCIVPNVNDYFITSTNSDKIGLFRINNIERKSFNTDAAFLIDYTLVGYLNAIPETFADLTTKVIREYFFDKERLTDFLQPMVKAEEYQAVSDLRLQYRKIVAYYFRMFYNREYQTLIVPGQSAVIYDAGLVNYMLKMVDTLEANEIRHIKQIPTDNDPFISQPNIWDAMTAADHSVLDYANKKMGMVSKFMFNSNTWIPGLRYSLIDYVVYPDTPDTSTLSGHQPQAKILSESSFDDTKTSNNGLGAALDNRYVTTSGTLKLFHAIRGTETYIMSTAFYEGTGDLSVIEILTRDYLQGKTIDLKMIGALIKGFERLTRLEQFYFGPFLLTVIRAAERGQYS